MLCVGQIAAVEKLHDSHHRVERIADIVAQHREQIRLVFRDLFRLSPREQQFPLVPAPVGRVEQRNAIENRPSVVASPKPRVRQNRQLPPVCAHNVKGDFAHEPLHLQQRRVVRLVINPRSGGEQRLELRAATGARLATCRVHSSNV